MIKISGGHISYYVASNIKPSTGWRNLYAELSNNLHLKVLQDKFDNICGRLYAKTYPKKSNSQTMVSIEVSQLFELQAKLELSYSACLVLSSEQAKCERIPSRWRMRYDQSFRLLSKYDVPEHVDIIVLGARRDRFLIYKHRITFDMEDGLLGAGLNRYNFAKTSDQELYARVLHEIAPNYKGLLQDMGKIKAEGISTDDFFNIHLDALIDAIMADTKIEE